MMNPAIPQDTQTTSIDDHNWKSDFHIWLPLLIWTWVLAIVFRDRFISDWDGFDYAANVINNVPTALGLGRALFLAYNQMLWKMAHRWFDLPPEQSYLVLKYGVIAMSGPTVVGVYALYKEITATRLAACFGTLMVVFSPLFIIYSGRGMSEIPGLLMLAWSLWWMIRSLRIKRMGGYFAAVAIFGLSANMREFAPFYLPIVPLAAIIYGISWKRWLPATIFAVLAMLAGAIFWSLYWPEYYIPAVRNWLQLSALESEKNPVTLGNLRFMVEYGFRCSAAAFVIAPFALIEGCRQFLKNSPRRVLFLLGLLGLTADLALSRTHYLSYSPRYLLTGLIGLAAISGWFLAELITRFRGWKAAIPALVAIGLTVANLITFYPYFQKDVLAAQVAREYLAKITDLPDDAVFIVGAHTPLVNFYRRSGARKLWKVIPAGAGWPDDKLDREINDYLSRGIPVFVDFDENLWNPGQINSREAAGLQMIKRVYQLDLVRNPSLYRISRSG